MIRVEIPGHLCSLAGIPDRVAELDVAGPVTTRTVLDAVEARFPALKGTIREHGGGPRRAFIRFFACGQDLSHDSVDDLLPDAVVRGEEPFLIVAAIAGGKGFRAC